VKLQKSRACIILYECITYTRRYTRAHTHTLHEHHTHMHAHMHTSLARSVAGSLWLNPTLLAPRMPSAQLSAAHLTKLPKQGRGGARYDGALSCANQTRGLPCFIALGLSFSLCRNSCARISITCDCDQSAHTLNKYAEPSAPTLKMYACICAKARHSE